MEDEAASRGGRSIDRGGGDRRLRKRNDRERALRSLVPAPGAADDGEHQCCRGRAPQGFYHDLIIGIAVRIRLSRRVRGALPSGPMRTWALLRTPPLFKL